MTPRTLESVNRGLQSHAFPVRSPDPEPGIAHVLIVCHANQCRSPYAAAIARQRAGEGSVRFASGGLIRGGRPMPQTGRLLAPQYGLDFEAHRSREVDLHDFGGFDLVLAMAREQARELVVADPDAWPRIFTVKQFARWIEKNPRPAGVDLGPWLDTVAADRPRTSLIGSDEADDVADPVGLPAAAWHSMIAEVTANIQVIIGGISSGR